jgi:hypothetical protein
MSLVASQAGHLLAYALVYGPVAGRMQSTGAHAYFPALVKTAFGLAAMFVVLALVVIGLARLLGGRRLERGSSGSYVRMVSMLFCLQLTCFVVQEKVEMAAGAPSTSAVSLLLWGTAGQLPVALVAAIALRWLAVRLGPAVARLLGAAVPLFQFDPRTVALVSWPALVPAAATPEWRGTAFTPRGPPS